ncbi:uncharacterized protein LOC6552965 [Drosophila erecta]|nr:uncharacterized protein LOC6552965 [Drosophila erecta]
MLAVAGGQLAQAKGKCVHCAVAAERICQRCGDFYCSKDCQRQDWLRHRYICIPLPALVYPNANNVFQSDGESTLGGACSINADKTAVEGSPSTFRRSDIITAKNDVPIRRINSSNSISSNNRNTTKEHNFNSPPNANMPQSGGVVYIMQFSSSNRCYIRDASESADKAFAQVCNKVNTMATTLPRINNPPLVGFCLARHNDMYWRAKMWKIGNQTRLFLVDLGIVKPLNSDLKDISVELLSLPSFFRLVQLKNVLKYDFSDDVIAFCSQFVGKKYTIAYKKSPGCYFVELVDTEMKFSVNEKLNAFFDSKKFLGNPNSAAQNGTTYSLDGPQPSQVGEPITIPAVKSSQAEPQSAETMGQKILKKPEDQNECEKNKEVNTLFEIANTVNKTKGLDAKGASNDKLGFIDENKTSFPADRQTKTTPVTSLKPEDQDVKDLTHCLALLDKSEMPIHAKENKIVTQKNEPVLKPHFELRKFSIETKEGIDVFVVESSKKNRGIFGAFDRAYASEFSTLQSRLSEITDYQPYKPVLREYVLARFEGSWYRGRVEHIIVAPQQQTKYRVMNLDYTNVEDITQMDICRYPSDFNTPCPTNLCVIDDFPHKLNAAQISYLSEALEVNQLVHIDSVNYLNHIAIIKSRSLIEKLMSL